MDTKTNIKSHAEAREKLSKKQQADIVNWYADTICLIEDVPIKEINFYFELHGE